MTIPPELLTGPFTCHDAELAGVTGKVLRGRRFRRVLPRVWAHASYEMTDQDWIAAASMVMSERARLSHLSRIQALGLMMGPLRPFHFTIVGGLHLDVPDIFLHRTRVLPPVDDVGVTPAAAYLQLCSSARLIDAIKIGDWLLRNNHMSLPELAGLASREAWRPGAKQAGRVLNYLDAGSRSLRESESRAVIVFSGLPAPEVNKDVRDTDGVLIGCGDLVYLRWKLLVEYEGRQHVEDVAQWNVDIDRYRAFRDEGWRYVQITNEKLSRPKKCVSEVYAQLVRSGYDGPAPVFGRRWESLFRPVTVALSR